MNCPGPSRGFPAKAQPPDPTQRSIDLLIPSCYFENTHHYSKPQFLEAIWVRTSACFLCITRFWTEATKWETYLLCFEALFFFPPDAYFSFDFLQKEKGKGSRFLEGIRCFYLRDAFYNVNILKLSKQSRFLSKLTD